MVPPPRLDGLWHHPLFSLIPEPHRRLRQKEGEKQTTLRNSSTTLPDQEEQAARSGPESWFARQATNLRKYPADRAAQKTAGCCVVSTTEHDCVGDRTR